MEAGEVTDYTLANRMAIGRTAELFALEGRPDRVVKLFLPGFESNAARELGIADLLAEIGVPAPAAIGSIELDGRQGVVFERIEGRTMLTLFEKRPWTIPSHGRLMADLHLGIHSASGEGLPSLAGALARNIDRAPAILTAEKSAVQALLDRLPPGDRLCHGDFHPDNILLGDHRPVTIDWNDARCGAPLADVARTVVLIRCGAPPRMPVMMRLLHRFFRTLLLSSYLRRYEDLTRLDREELRDWTVVVAAGRLSEGIANEEKRLLKIVQAGLEAG